jgi:arginyl-tRNA synthetase
LPNLSLLLTDRLAPAFAAVAGEPVDPVVRRSQRAHFQADGALALAKRLGRNPREIAGDIAERAELADVASSVEVAGPGFINMTLRDDTLGELLTGIVGDERLGVPPAVATETVVVDYSAPNVAKEMHVGNMRSTVIGDAIVRLLGWLGHQIIKANHLGDWGTPFGMLIEHLVDMGEDEAAHELSVGDLEAFYQAARRKFDADDAFKERSRRRVVALQSGDETTRRLWHLLVEQSESYFLAVYDRLDVRLTKADFVGESFYNDMLESVVDELAEHGLLRDSEGAKCVFPAGFTNRDGDPLPLIVRKSDGGYGYATTDLAAVRYRTGKLAATRLLYVVGAPQHQHFEMVFAAAREAGWLVEPARAEHVSFGSVLGTDGKMLRTRAGTSVKLIELLDEAVARAADVVAEKNPSLDVTEREAVARIVGIGAVKYADLSTDRRRDYVFDYDRMLSFDGNTAPYLQYAHARIHSIFRRAGIDPSGFTGGAGGDGAGAGDRVVVAEPAEQALALELLGFGGVVDEVADTLEFHRLAGYLYGLATTFTSFYEQCPVLRAGGGVRASRLALCALTSRTLAVGLALLGIVAPDRM